VNWVDPLVLLWVALSALVGFGRGLIAQVLSLAGLALGGFVGSRVAPLFLSDGHASPWVPLASLVGAVVGALLLQVGATFAGHAVRMLLARGPLRLVDAGGGALAGSAIGLAVAWLAAVAALQIDRIGARESVQSSVILSSLVEAVPPEGVLQALARFDPLPLVAARPDVGLPPPDASVSESDAARRAQRAVIKIEGIACGVGIQGSGWVVARNLVATNAHVVAGQKSTQVLVPNGDVLSAQTVYFDPTNDVALLRVRGLGVRPLEIGDDPSNGEQVVLLGYPNDGNLVARAATAGRPRKVISPDAYGGRPGLRTVVPLRGKVEHGESGGPVVDANGEVVAMIFAASKTGRGGFGVPLAEIEEGLDSPLDPVSTGRCS
jgi:S1-C subfamily serine protease